MNFLEFYVTNGGRAYINLDKVMFARPSEKIENATQLFFSGNDYITVKEPYSEVVMRIVTRRPVGVNTYAEYRG